MPITALMMRRRGHGAVTLPPAPPAVFALGFNLSGFEGDQYNSSGGANLVTAMVNTYLPYFAGKGFVKVRVPFLWSRMQPTVDGDLDPTYLGYVKQVVAAAAALGMQVRLDNHSYGVGPGGLLGSSGQPLATFGRFWAKMAAAFVGLAGVAQYDLNNEWHSMDPNYVDFVGDRGVFDKPVNPASDYAKNLIFTAQQQAITAIRAIDTTATIVIEGLHFTGAWDWLTNNTNLFSLFDPQNNVMFSGHSYLDSDSSGTNFGWASEVAKAGVSPPGVPTSTSIGVTRLTSFMNELTRRGLRPDVGEFGASNDLPPAGTDDYADWNTALDNMIAFAQANQSEMYYFCAGPGYDSYPMSINPAGGFQARQMVILDKYHGFPGAQPTTYILRYPLDTAGRAISRTPVSVASGAFLVDYRGKLDTPTVVTPHAMLMDGTDAGGTFTPASVTLAPGLNSIASFTYTPALDGATFIISTTNNKGWTDPAPLGFSSKIDALAKIPASVNLRTVFGLRRLVSSYIGDAITLKRASDGTTQTFKFNNRGDLPRQAIQDWAGSRTIAAVSMTYQDGSGTIIDFTTYKDNFNASHPSTPPNLTLVNADGFPEITWAGGTNKAQFSSPDTNQTQQSIITRAKHGSGSYMMAKDIGVGPWQFSPTGYIVGTNGRPAGVSPGGTTEAFHSYAGTFSSGVTNGLVGYKDGAQTAASNAVSFTFPPPTASGPAEMGYFINYQPSTWSGSWQSIIITDTALTATQIGYFASDDAAYYGTALPDSLGPVGAYPIAPAETPFAAPSGAWTPVSGTAAYKGVNIAGGDTGVGSTRPYSYDYFYGTTNEVDYFASKGFGSIRLWTTRGHIQPSSYGALDTTQMGYIKPLIDEAYARGVRVILDLHDYGGITDTTVSPSVFLSIGADQESINQFVDYWVRLATKFKNYPNAELGLMNEPNKAGVTASMWKAAVAQAITAIRAAGSTHLILIPGVASSAAQAWTSSGNAAAWAGFNGDPANNFMFDVHQYLDQYNTGQSENYTVGGGATRLNSDSCTTWMRSNGFKARLTETGWVADSQTWSGSPPSTEGGAILTYMSSNSDVWAGWNFMAGGCALYYSSYPHGTVVPSGYPSGPFTDQPQMALLTAHL